MRRTRRIVMAALTTCVALVAACGTTPTAPPTAPTEAPPVESLGPPTAGQTDTEWGRIWDTIPADFPVYPGATPADETAEGPASGMFVVDGDVSQDVPMWMITSLIVFVGVDDDGSTDIEGPREDGSYLLTHDGDGDCRVQVTAAPLGGLTSITILYGAACPNP